MKTRFTFLFCVTTTVLMSGCTMNDAVDSVTSTFEGLTSGYSEFKDNRIKERAKDYVTIDKKNKLNKGRFEAMKLCIDKASSNSADSIVNKDAAADKTILAGNVFIDKCMYIHGFRKKSA